MFHHAWILLNDFINKTSKFKNQQIKFSHTYWYRKILFLMQIYRIILIKS
jgi:hypothetical protein